MQAHAATPVQAHAAHAALQALQAHAAHAALQAHAAHAVLQALQAHAAHAALQALQAHAARVHRMPCCKAGSLAAPRDAWPATGSRALMPPPPLEVTPPPDIPRPLPPLGTSTRSTIGRVRWWSGGTTSRRRRARASCTRLRATAWKTTRSRHGRGCWLGCRQQALTGHGANPLLASTSLRCSCMLLPAGTCCYLLVHAATCSCMLVHARACS